MSTDPDPIWVLDLDAAHIVWANDPALRFWGASDIRDLETRDLSSLVSAPTRARLSEYRDEYHRGLSARDLWTLQPMRGQDVTVETLTVPIEMGPVRRTLLCQARPVASDAALLRSQQALRQTGVMVTMCGPQGDLLMENAAAQQAYRLSDRTEASLDAFDVRFMDRDVARRARAQLERGEPYSQEVEVQTASGPRWHSMDVRVSVDPVTDGPCWILNEQDISARKQKETIRTEARTQLEQGIEARTAELARERDFFESVFATVSALILVTDAEGRILRANDLARSVFHGPLAGQSAFEVCGFPSPANLAQWMQDGQAVPEAVEIPVETDSQRRRHILWTARLHRPPGGAPQLLLSGVDITELREAETQLQITDRMATIGTLTAGIAHDLNNPLSYAINNAEMLLQRVQGDRGLREMAEDILEGTRRAAAIVVQMKTFSKGSASGEFGTADVRSVVEFSARMAHNHIKHKAQVTVECPEGLFARIDESKLGQVALNLLVHAVEAIEAGGASRHHVSVRARQADAQWLTIEVANTGPGLDVDQMRRIFDPYAAGHTPPKGYSGLGLAISHRLVTEAGGRIEVDSTEEKGTRVQVWLRSMARPTPTPGSALPAVSGTPRAEAVSKPKILVVDDEEKLRSVIRRALNEYEVHGAQDGREALDRMAIHNYDLILCDIMMPEMTGVELYEHLSKAQPAMAKRFVFLSGGAFTPETRAFLDRTDRAVVDKPFLMRELRVRVRQEIARVHEPS